MKRNFRFTSEQDNMIKNYVTLFSHNLNLGFELCSLELKCKKEEVKDRWYDVLRKGEALFITGNPISSYKNTKNVLRTCPKPEYKVNRKSINLMSGTVSFKKK